jgi:hypothetical protein
VESSLAWFQAWGDSWASSWGPLHEVYEPPRISGPDNAGRDYDYEQERHFEAMRAVGQKLYAKPEVVEPAQVVTPEAPTVEAPPSVEPPQTIASNPEIALLRTELDEIQQSVTALANDAIAKAKRQADDEEALILILSQIL